MMTVGLFGTEIPADAKGRDGESSLGVIDV